MIINKSHPKVFFFGKRANIKTGVSRRQSTSKFPKNKHFLPPDTHTCVCVSGGKKCLFFGNFDVLCFLETPVSRFALFKLYYQLQRIIIPPHCQYGLLKHVCLCVKITATIGSKPEVYNLSYFFSNNVICLSYHLHEKNFLSFLQ